MKMGKSREMSCACRLRSEATDSRLRSAPRRCSGRSFSRPQPTPTIYVRVATYGSFGGASPDANFQEYGNVMAGPSMQCSAVGRNRARCDDYLL